MRRAEEGGVPEVPEELLAAVVSGKCVLFAGAGISRGIAVTDQGEREQYLPTWGNLLIALAIEALRLEYITSSQQTQLRKCVKDGKYLLVAETLKKKLGQRELDRILDSIFRSPNLRWTKRHEIITEIPFAAIITTNYDKLIESSYATIKKYFPPTYAFDNAPDVIDSLSNNRFFILKVHGDIDRKETIVLSERDYRNIIYREPGYRAALNAIFITRTVLFAGTSLVDPDIRLFLESISESFTGRGPVHFALLPEKEAADVEVTHWRDFFGIRLLRYKATKGHCEIDIFLKNLRDAVTSLKQHADK